MLDDNSMYIKVIMFLENRGFGKSNNVLKWH
jgi:hypothetical protein